jgi:hypothetical protein
MTRKINYRQILNDLASLITIAWMVQHGPGVAEWLPALDGRCRWCGYRRDHPIVVHDDVYAECGWR